MDGKGYINNPYLSVSSVLSKSYKILIEDAVRKEFEKLREEIYRKIREDLSREITEEVLKKLKSEMDNLKRDEWERIGSPDIK